MTEYPKIQTLWKRDPATKFKTLLRGEWACEEFAYLAANLWEWTEKVDGTNIRVMWDGERVTFGGKTDRAQIPSQLVNRLNEMFLPRAGTMATVFDGPTCLYGEGYGAKIQKGGGRYSATPEFVLFDVKVGDWWLRRDDVDDVASKLDLHSVPVIGQGSLRSLVDYVAVGFQSAWGPFDAEGVVARPLVPLFARNGERVITKLKARDFAAPPAEEDS